MPGTASMSGHETIKTRVEEVAGQMSALRSDRVHYRIFGYVGAFGLRKPVMLSGYSSDRGLMCQAML